MAFGSVLQQFVDGSCQGSDVADWYQSAGLVVIDYFACAFGGRSDNWDAGCHCFNDGQAERLRTRRGNKEIERRQECRHVICPAD